MRGFERSGLLVTHMSNTNDHACTPIHSSPLCLSYKLAADLGLWWLLVSAYGLTIDSDAGVCVPHGYLPSILVTGHAVHVGSNLTRVTLWRYSYVHPRFMLLDLSEGSVRGCREVAPLGKETPNLLDDCSFDKIMCSPLRKVNPAPSCSLPE